MAAPATAWPRVPLVVRTELLFPYVDGFSFVRQAYRQAGNNYAAVDELSSKSRPNPPPRSCTPTST